MTIFKVCGFVSVRLCGNSGAFQEMMRDAEELPAILAELEDAWRIVERSLYVFVP